MHYPISVSCRRKSINCCRSGEDFVVVETVIKLWYSKHVKNRWFFVLTWSIFTGLVTFCPLSRCVFVCVCVCVCLCVCVYVRMHMCDMWSSWFAKWFSVFVHMWQLQTSLLTTEVKLMPPLSFFLNVILGGVLLSLQ